MDIKPQSTQPISDDQELAKVLAGVNNSQDDSSATPAMSDIPAPMAAGLPPAAPEDTAAEVEATLEPAMPPMPDPIATPLPGLPTMPAMGSDLDGVKLEALNELRPLVDKLNVTPEEKFDTYLLLIRSTDDKALVAPAHEAAKAIVDETRRAQALLDIIKEIDFLSNPQQ